MHCFASNCGDDLVRQSDMNECAYKDYIDTDKKLNAIYKQILAKYKDYPKALQNTIKAERAWIQFRDAQLAMKFPPLKMGNHYGTWHPIFKYDYLSLLTEQRIAQLNEIINDDYVDDLNK